MRVTFVVQRYGEEVLGGSESLARQVAERLAPHYELQVLTSCALDYTTWENVYEPGESVINGVRVRRFPSIQTRDPAFDRLSARLYGEPHTLQEEVGWLRAQGPRTPELLDYLGRHREESDVFLFFTYIYYPTALGLRRVADRAVLVPTAHDEPPLYFDFFKGLFHAPRALLYNTEEERRFVQGQFDNSYIPNAVAGIGVETPAGVEPERLRQKLGLTGPYFLYLGRIVSAKGCDELVSHFQAYQRRFPGEASLLLLGKAEMELPSIPGLIYGGFVSEEEKYDAIAGAEAVIIPSRYESLSLIALEAWGLGRPVICNGHSEVVRGMSQRGNGGLYYYDAEEFCEALHLVMSAKEVAAQLGRQGRSFVDQTYRWPVVEKRYRDIIEQVGGMAWR